PTWCLPSIPTRRSSDLIPPKGKRYVSRPVLRLSPSDYHEIVGHALDALPLEACGLFAARPGGEKVLAVYRCRNAADSARVYTVADRKSTRLNSSHHITS